MDIDSFISLRTIVHWAEANPHVSELFKQF